MKNKGTGVSGLAMQQPQTHVTFEGQHAKALSKHEVGSKHKIVIHGTKTSHYQNMDGTHTVGFKVSKVQMANDTDGGKEEVKDNEV